MDSDLKAAADLVTKFTGSDLTATLNRIENSIRGLTAASCAEVITSIGARTEILDAAAEMKRAAGQINVTIHALGILLCLPSILQVGERVEYVSLGAGNTGRQFDLETDRRVAEFKFIHWRGGAESTRQNSLFKDYFLLAEHRTGKSKHLYVLGAEHALKFLRGGRALSSVLSRNEKLKRMFLDRFGEKYRTVGEYYAACFDAVQIEDASPWLSTFAGRVFGEAEIE